MGEGLWDLIVPLAKLWLVLDVALGLAIACVVVVERIAGMAGGRRRSLQRRSSRDFERTPGALRPSKAGVRKADP